MNVLPGNNARCREVVQFREINVKRWLIKSLCENIIRLRSIERMNFDDESRLNSLSSNWSASDRDGKFRDCVEEHRSVPEEPR